MSGRYVGSQSVLFEKPPLILQTASAGGMLEQQGPLGKALDIALSDEMNHEDSWEKAECQMVLGTIRRVIQKSGLNSDQIRYIFAGDLMNQDVYKRQVYLPGRFSYGACDEGGGLQAFSGGDPNGGRPFLREFRQPKRHRLYGLVYLLFVCHEDAGRGQNHL